MNMETKKIEYFLEKKLQCVPYKNYMVFKNVAIGIHLASFPTYLLMFQNSPAQMLSFLLGSGILSYSVLYGEYEKFTQEIKQMKDIKEEFLNKFLVLLENYEASDPNEIYAIYQCGLYQGLFSYNHFYKYENNNVLDIPDNLSQDIFLGLGSCRHVSSLLVDIYQKQGLNTSYLSVYDHDIQKPAPSDFIQKIRGATGNHAVVGVEFNGESNYYDPTNQLILRKKENCLFSNGTANYIARKTMKNKIAKEILNLPVADYKKSAIKYLDMCDKINRDVYILSEFYDNTEELYREMFDIAIKIKTRK